MLLTGIFHFYTVDDHLINSRGKYNFQNAILYLWKNCYTEIYRVWDILGGTRYNLLWIAILKLLFLSLNEKKKAFESMVFWSFPLVHWLLKNCCGMLVFFFNFCMVKIHFYPWCQQNLELLINNNFIFFTFKGF